MAVLLVGDVYRKRQLAGRERERERDRWLLRGVWERAGTRSPWSTACQILDVRWLTPGHMTIHDQCMMNSTQSSDRLAGSLSRCLIHRPINRLSTHPLPLRLRAAFAHAAVMWLHVGFLWSQGADDMWDSDGDGRAWCSSQAYERRRRQCPMWNSVKWKERYRKS